MSDDDIIEYHVNYFKFDPDPMIVMTRNGIRAERWWAINGDLGIPDDAIVFHHHYDDEGKRA